MTNADGALDELAALGSARDRELIAAVTCTWTRRCWRMA